MPVGGQQWNFRGAPIGQLYRGTGSKKVTNYGSFNLTEKFVRLLIFSALITFCYGVISLPSSSKLFSRLFPSKSEVQMDTDQKQRNDLRISIEEVEKENGDENEQKHSREEEEKRKAIIMIMAAAAAATDALVKIQQNEEQILREAKEALKEPPEKMQIDTPKKEQEVLQDKVHNNGTSKGLPPLHVGPENTEVAQRP